MKNLIRLHDNLIHFKQLEEKTFAEYYLDENEDVIIWCITRRCNFSCKYCNFTNNQQETIFDKGAILDAFNREGKKWHIIVTGGEPLLKKEVVDIFEELCHKHTLFINTNLSLSFEKLNEFIKRVNPEKVGMNIAVHVEEREKIDVNFENFFKKIQLIKKAGISFFVSYVFYPSLISRIDKDFDFLKSNGIEKLTLKPFFGNFDNKNYPFAYNDKEKKYLKKYYLPEFDLGDSAPQTNFKGNLCFAGKRTFYIDENGFARRCENSKDVYGNFFNKNFESDIVPKICNEKASVCPYQCLIYAKKRKKSFLSGLKINFSSGKR